MRRRLGPRKRVPRVGDPACIVEPEVAQLGPASTYMDSVLICTFYQGALQGRNSKSACTARCANGTAIEDLSTLVGECSFVFFNRRAPPSEQTLPPSKAATIRRPSTHEDGKTAAAPERAAGRGRSLS